MKTLWSRKKMQGWPACLDKQKILMYHYCREQRKFNPEIEYVRFEQGLYFVSMSFQMRPYEPNAPRTIRVDVYDQTGVLELFECRSLKEAKRWAQLRKGKKLQAFVRWIHPDFIFVEIEENGEFSCLRFGSKTVLTWEELEANDLYTLMVRVMSYNPIEIQKYHTGP